MRLIEIKPKYFRGFGNSDWINLDNNLVILHGPNGFGKTSLAEAIEWLFYGKTKRRERGEALSQRDYLGSFRNVHTPEGEITAVEAKIKLSNGTSYNLRRELIIGTRNSETSETFINENPDNFSSIGISDDERYYPVVAQHSLQDFIHSRPKDRRDKISAALGLDVLVRYKTIVDKSRIRFRNNPLPEVVNAQNQLKNVIRAMKQSSRVENISSRWDSDDIKIERDLEELKQLASEFLGKQLSDFDSIKMELIHRRKDTAHRVFDTKPIRLTNNLENSLQGLKAKKSEINSNISTLSIIFDQFLNATVSLYSKEQIQLWQAGLSLQKLDGKDKCPMCEADTLTESKRNELEQRINASSTYIKSLQKLDDQSKLVAKFIQELIDSLMNLFPSFLDVKNRTSLINLFQDEREQCTTFLKKHDEVRTTVNGSLAILNNYVKYLQILHEKASNPLTVQDSRDLIKKLKSDFEQLFNTIIEHVNFYSAADASFSDSLTTRITNDGAVKEIDGLLAPIENLRHIKILAEYNNLLDESLLLIRQIEIHIQEKQTELFLARGKEICDWYDMMNPRAEVRYCRMEPGTDSLVLWAQSFGVDINAVSCLSQCQLNCLGLSIHLIRVATPGTPFSFLIMDDPVQSMDDDHYQALIGPVINDLLENKNLQLIILSHVQGMIDGIREIYFDLQPLRLRISDFDNNIGPNIELEESLQQTITRARNLANGNEGNRRLAIKVVRRCVELLIREICLLTNSQSPPDTASATNMLPYFRDCPNTTPRQVQGLQNTINFSNPSVHTQPGWSVPTQPQIIPHIDRINQIAKKLNIF